MASIQNTDYGQAGGAAFMGDFGNREHIVPGGALLDVDGAYTTDDTQTVEVGVGGAAAAAVSVPVVALTDAIESGTALRFGNKLAVLSADAAQGATSIAVAALTAALTAGEKATINDTGQEIVPAGTAVGRTNAEKISGAAFGPAADSDDEIFLMIGDCDISRSNEIELYRYGSIVKFNFLPRFTDLSTAVKNKLHVNYVLVKG